jgi:hypothetical protein
MAIAVSCSCGKHLRVNDDYAGRKIRCPGCDKILRVPDDSEEEDREEPSRRVRADRPLAKKAPARRAREDEEDYDDDEPEVRAPRRGRKQQKRSAVPLILGGVALLLVLGGGGFAGYWFFLRGENISESAFLAPDAQGFISMRLAVVAKLDGFQKLMKAQGSGGELNDAVSKMGLNLAEIERFTYVMSDIEQQAGWAVLTTTKPYDKKAVLAKLENAAAFKHEGKTYHVGQFFGGGLAGPSMPGKAGPAAAGGAMTPGGKTGGMPKKQVVFFAGPNVLVLAEEEASMKRGLTAALRKSPTGPLADAVKQIGGPKQVYFALHLPPSAQEKLKSGLAMMGPQAKPAAPLLQFSAVSGSLDYGTNVVLDLALKYADDGRAKAAMTSFTALKGLAEIFLPQGGPGEALKTALAGLSAEQRGAELAVKLQVASKLLEGALPQMPGGPPGAPGK